MKNSHFFRFLFICILFFRFNLEAAWVEPQDRAAHVHRVAVVGTGYVGLTLGACLAECGHQVVCIDIDAVKIARLMEGTIPIYEPGLAALVQKNIKEGRLNFTTSLEEGAKKSDAIFIAVGTPTENSGRADLAALFKVIEELKPFKDRLICIKSTVPVGTCRYLRSLLEESGEKKVQVEIVSNPEFFREGSAVKDFFEGDRIIVGCSSSIGAQTMQELYAPLLDKKMSILITSLESSEMIKYASNAFLAVKIAYINELSQFCEKTGADVLEVAQGMGLDQRIGRDFLKPGPGYGGSCFPKDTMALLHAAKTHDLDLQIVSAAINSNESHKQTIFQKALGIANKNTPDRVVAIWGLAFKANTDDIRYSPALGLISSLLAQGVEIRAYDPAASSNMQAVFPNITYCASPYEAAEGADRIVLLTEWNEFLHIDLDRLKHSMRTLSIFDTRNVLDRKAYETEGFSFEGLGRTRKGS
jgi:UDPglucose 6-dehydrogenase